MTEAERVEQWLDEHEKLGHKSDVIGRINLKGKQQPALLLASDLRRLCTLAYTTGPN